MRGQDRFTPGQINKALRLLRELPVKDTRKNSQEALRLLEQGMLEALEKGYSREDIRAKIAEAQIVVSATALKVFLTGKRKAAGQNMDDAAVRKSDASGQNDAQVTVRKTQNTGQKQREKTVGTGRSDDTAAERSTAKSSVGNTVDHDRIARSKHDGEAVREAETSPGSLIIRPDTPREEL